jgi:hypothetical protein
MSTSYTGTLKLGKPAAGDTGWGNTLNGEVTDMVEEAISGMSTINTWSAATPAVHTLTEANGSTSESRAAILRLTDTTGDIASVANLIVPDNTKLYCVINETGHTVTVKTASGTGISIPTAVQANVVCNGTNVVEQTNYNSALVAATATADTLKITAGGTGITAFVDEDNMASNSATAIASQQSIKAYVDNNGSFNYPEEIVPWAASTTMTSSPSVVLDDTNTFVTLAEFTVPANSDTNFHVIDLSAQYDLRKIGTASDTIGMNFELTKKVKVNTGTTLGTVVTRGQKGGTDSYFWSFTVAGDKRQDLGQATKVGLNNTAGSDTGKYEIESFAYDAANNRTEIVFNNGSRFLAGGTFNIGNTAYIATDGWQSVGSYLQIQANVMIDQTALGGAEASPVPITNNTVSFPKVIVKNSDNNATEFRLQGKPRQLAGNDTPQVRYYKTYVTAQNIRRG